MVYWDVTPLKIKEHLEYCKCLLTGVHTTGIPPTNCCRLMFLKYHTCLIIASQKPLKILCDLQIKSKCFSLAFRRLLQPPVLVTNFNFFSSKTNHYMHRICPAPRWILTTFLGFSLWMFLSSIKIWGPFQIPSSPQSHSKKSVFIAHWSCAA